MLAQLIVMNYITNFVDTLLIFYCIIKVFEKKIINRFYSISLLMGLILLNTLINIAFGLANALGFTAIIIVSTVVFSFLLNTDPIITFFVGIAAVTVMFILEIVVVQLIIFIFKISPSILLELNIYRILAILFAKGLFWAIVEYWVEKIHLPQYPMLHKIYPILFIAFFNVLIIFMTFILYKYIIIETIYDYFYMFGMALGVIILSWFLYAIIKKFMLQSQREMLWEMKEKEYKNQSFYFQSMQDILQTIKAQRHDFNNYISTLYGLIHLGKLEEAKQYITRLGENISYMNEIIETNHPVITALLNVKRHKALNEKVDMKTSINLPGKLSVDFIDLSVILGNLLDNALEACEKVPIKDRTVELSMYVEEKYFIIQIINSKNDEVRVDTEKVLSRYTSKEDSSNHGFGLRNIKQVVDHYNGLIKMEDTGNRFNVNIALLLKEDTE